MLLNLLSNACKFQNDGKIKVKAYLVKESAQTDNNINETFITISVIDRGIGISQ